jgi:hypothetical protein
MNAATGSAAPSARKLPSTARLQPSTEAKPVPAVVVAESQARSLLCAHPGDGLEAWLADQPWQVMQEGSWRVEPEHDGWTFRVEGLPSQAVRVVVRVPGAKGSVDSWLIGTKATTYSAAALSDTGMTGGDNRSLSTVTRVDHPSGSGFVLPATSHWPHSTCHWATSASCPSTLIQ